MYMDIDTEDLIKTLFGIAAFTYLWANESYGGALLIILLLF